MEPYSMPQLDKSSPVYSEKQYEGDDTSNGRPTTGNAKKYIGVASEPLPLLTSSAWSAVIHHPAEDDSEPDDLPSTVDMDAIKGSPATPLAASSKLSTECWEKSKRRGGEGEEGSDSEGSDGDEDSDSSDDSDSASDSGSESGSCTWSESESGSTSCSSRSLSSQSSRVHQTFSIRETNIDQGGLKLKISALKVPRKIVAKEVNKPDASVDDHLKSKVQADDVVSQEESELPLLTIKPTKNPHLPLKIDKSSLSDAKPKIDKVQIQVPSMSKIETTGSPGPATPEKTLVPKVEKSQPANTGATSKSERSNNNEPPNASKPDKIPTPNSMPKGEKLRTMTPSKLVKNQPTAKEEKTHASLQNLSKSENKNHTETKSKADKGGVVHKNPSTSASKTCAPKTEPQCSPSTRTTNSRASTRSETRKTDTRLPARHKTKVSSVTGGRGIYNMRVPGATPTPTGCTGSTRSATRAVTPQSATDTEDEGEEISEIAQQLVSAEQESIAISEHLQVINQEDLAAILPDVITLGHQDDEVCTPFDGFEDVSSESGKAANRGVESSSDVELPEQVVSAAIQRIHLDGGQDSSSDGASCDDEAVSSVGHPYSSSLLQQFVEKTKLLSSQASDKSTEVPKRRKRGRPPKSAKSKRVPEIEAYMQLDLSVSNVSPDSGIQSVAGSPPRRSVSPVLGPNNTDNSPQSPSSENGSPNYATEENRQKSKPKTSMSEIRRGRGRPKGSVKKGKRLNSDFASGTDSCDEIPPAPSLSTTVKRRPGRPKKTIPNVEPTTTIDLKCDDDRAHGESEHLVPVKKDILNIEKIFKSESKPHSKKKNSDIIKLTDKNTNSPKSYDGLVGGKQPKSSAILSEICERVSKRLDLPLHSVTSYPLKLTKVKLTKDSLRGGKLKRGRRKRELGEGSEKEAKDKRRRRFSSSSPGSSHRGNGSRNHSNNSIKPASTPQVPAPRLLSLPHGVPHKHKKKKKKSKPVKAVRIPEDPALLTDLERLVHMFRRSCTIAIARNASSRSEGNLPSIFRVKRIGKKRKGSEKSRNSQLTSMSDRDSGGEGDGKEKEKSRQRRPKKSTVEPPKGHHERTEPANNEQRLPLKKRHYHMSLPPVPLTSQDSQNTDKTQSCDKITSSKILPGDGTRKSVSSERTTDKNVDKTMTKSEKCSSAPSKSSQAEVKVKAITETHRNSRNSVNSERIVEKANDKTVVKLEKNVNSGKVMQTDLKSKSQTEVLRKLATVESTRKSMNSERTTEKAGDKVVIKAEKGASLSIKSGHSESKPKAIAEVPRNSIDEVIEACITRYSTPSMITTPKKRHRLENTAAVSPRNLPTASVKAKDAEVTVNSKASAQPSKRATSRSASAATAANSPPSVVETKPLDGIFEPSSKTINLDLPTSLPTFLTRTALSNKSILPNSKSNCSNLLATETLPSTTTDLSLASVGTNSGKNSVPTKSASNSPLEKTICKPLTISIEQHSVENSGTSQNSNIISPKNKVPNKSSVKANSPKVSSPMSKVNSPKSVDVLTEITSDVTPFHNLRLKRSNGTIVEETNSSKLVSKKKKLISADVRIQVTKISPAELMLNAKKKVRRRKAINRTGFPVKKKKKKKINLPAETILTYEGEDCEALIPKSIISVINVTNDVSLKNSANDKASETVQPKHTNTRLSKSVDTTESKLGRTKNANKCKEKISHLDRSITRVVKNNEGNESESDRPSSRTEMEIDLSILEPEVLIYERTRKRKRESDVINDTKVLQPQFPPVLKRIRKCKEDDTDSDVIVPDDVPSCDESTKSGPRKKQPRWRKKFLVAGLFSDYFKEDEPRRIGDAASKQRLTTYKPEEHKYGLLPPPYHCGRYLRQRKVEFKLPYDMWWQHLNSQLPGRDLVPSWNYKKIRTNVYYDVKPTYGYEAQACNCAPADVHAKVGCGDDCINRMVYTECSSQLCPCKEVCSNQKIQRHEWAPGLDKFMTKDKGWGVRTKQLIKTGDFILEYVGEVVSEKEFKDRMASRYIHDTHHYCLNLDGGLVIDGHRMGGDGRFVNHSCEPNCEMQKWSVHGLFRMALFALRDVSPDEELSYDYNFSLFNPAEGQPCKCGSSHCRGVIGGKSQRLNGMPAADKGERRVVGRPRKNARKNNANIRIRSKKRAGGDISSKTPVKPMSHQQRCFAQLHHCFLLRNLEKVKRLRERLKDACRREQQVAATSANYTRPVPKHSDVFMAQLNALSCPRNMRTRRLAQAEDNPELTKTARLAYVFRDLYNIVIAAKDERNEMLATPFLTLPNKRKLPAYFQRITEPIDLSTLEQNIVTGFYRTVETFDTDMVRLFANNVRFFGRTSELGIVATRLKKVYNTAKMDFLLQLEEILGESPPPSFLPENDPGGEEEDVIRCICGLYKDEGTMIQCERCLVWQHCDCVRADKGIEHYLCEQCDGRIVDFEVKMEEIPSYATPGLEYYVTLLRGKLQLRQGDTVYVLRDMDEEGIPASQPPVKVTYKTVKEVKYTDLDIFRVERLWKDEKGDRFAFGHHFLRPHETYHEPSRKFFPNEVMRVPLYEVVPVELIMGRCWVLDVNTFCKGRPVNAPEEHIYVCEYRVDKSAHLFTKIARPRYPICTKTYAFDMFDAKVKPVRTYTPHGRVAPRARGPRGPAPIAVPDIAPDDPAVPGTPHLDDKEEHIPLARRTSQKVRLNTILLQLLARLPSKQPLDVSYLLEPGRRHRKKTSVLNT